jgi:hypothetical protein
MSYAFFVRGKSILSYASHIPLPIPCDHAFVGRKDLANSGFFNLSFITKAMILAILNSPKIPHGLLHLLSTMVWRAYFEGSTKQGM